MALWAFLASMHSMDRRAYQVCLFLLTILSVLLFPENRGHTLWLSVFSVSGAVLGQRLKCAIEMSLLFSVTSLVAWLSYAKRLGNNLDGVACPDSSWEDLKSRFKWFFCT